MFARAQGIQFALSRFGDDASAVWAGTESVRRSNEFVELQRLVHLWIRKGRDQMVAHLAEFLIQQGNTLGSVLDHLLAPVMRAIGHGYMEGEVSVGEEHLMTQTMRDALIALTFSASVPVSTVRSETARALVGSISGDAHELGALMTRLVLVAAGWNVSYAGLNVPTEEFAALQAAGSYDLVCISLTPPRGIAEVKAAAKLLDRLADPERPYNLVFGGACLNPDEVPHPDAKSIREQVLFNKLEPFEDWARAVDPLNEPR
jgi:methanogenic corrinoid protein MtbC1